MAVENRDEKWKTSTIYLTYTYKYKIYKINVLTLVESWLDRLMTCSRASHNSRLRRRTSAAWRSSAVDPYNDEPPDSNEAALPCTDDDGDSTAKQEEKWNRGSNRQWEERKEKKNEYKI